MKACKIICEKSAQKWLQTTTTSGILGILFTNKGLKGSAVDEYRVEACELTLKTFSFAVAILRT